jgi:hypothetical protein
MARLSSALSRVRPSSGEGWAGFISDEAPDNRPELAELVVAQV